MTPSAGSCFHSLIHSVTLEPSRWQPLLAWAPTAGAGTSRMPCFWLLLQPVGVLGALKGDTPLCPHFEGVMGDGTGRPWLRRAVLGHLASMRAHPPGTGSPLGCVCSGVQARLPSGGHQV